MRYIILISIFLITLIGCSRENNIVAPITDSTISTGIVKDSILYTFSVSKDTLGILDTLDMEMKVFNQSAEQDTFYIGDIFYNWSLTDAGGKIISSGPTIISNFIIDFILNPNQTGVLYHLKISMADIFGAPINAGVYYINWNLHNGLSFKLNLFCGKSENEITDTIGITSPVYPLKVGNKWTFKKTYYSSSGTAFGSDTISQAFIAETMIEGEKWFLLKSTSYADQLLTARQDGIYIYYPIIKTAVLKYKYPAAMGEEYTSGYEEWTGTTTTLVPFQMTVDSTDELISVPGGKYKCYKYHSPEVIAVFGMETNEVGSQDVLLSSIGPVKVVIGGIIWELISTNF